MSDLSLVASGGMIPHLSLTCGVCRWQKWGHSDEELERAYAAHLNGDRHAQAVAAVEARQDRIERYRLEALRSEVP